MREQTRPVYEFGPFRLDTGRRLLLKGEAVVKLTPKALETLVVLVEGRGQVLEREALMQRLWPNSFVEDGSLTLNISTLRKALGETSDQHTYIVTVPGHGYRFVAEVTVAAPEEGPPPPAETVAAPVFRWHPVAATLFGLVLLAGACGSVWVYSRTAAAVAARPQPLTLTRFATHGGVPFRVAISRDGKSLVYQQRMNGKDSLWLGQTDTNDSVPISQTTTNLIYGEPAFAPDGRSLYFTVIGDAQPRPTLVRMPVLGGVMTELVTDVDSPVTFSPDGAQLAFVRRDARTRQSSIVRASAIDGKNEHRVVTRDWPEAFSPLGLTWSPDGQTIAVCLTHAAGREEIVAVGVGDGRVRTLAARTWGVAGNLAWMPDGRGLVLIARDNNAVRKAHLWFVPFPEGEARKLTDDLNLYQRNSLSITADGKLAVLQGFIHSSIWVAPGGDARRARRVLDGVAPRYEGVDGLAWTSDGRLLYTAYTGDNLSIWSISRDGGDLRHVTGSGPGVVDTQMCVTADGRYIVFQSNRSRAFEIWRANIDGTGLLQLTTGGGNALPSVSPDGRWVIYTATRDGRSTLWRISIDGGTATQVTDWSSSYPQVSPDGTRIAYTAATDTADDRLAIMGVASGAALASFAVPRSGLTGRRVLRWTPDGNAILYKDDLRGLWRQPLDGGAPKSVRGFEALLLHHLAWSVDGKDLAYTAGPTNQEILLIDRIK